MESPQASSNNNSNNKNNNNNAKAVSCEAISVPHQIESKPASKTQKSAKVRTYVESIRGKKLTNIKFLVY